MRFESRFPLWLLALAVLAGFAYLYDKIVNADGSAGSILGLVAGCLVAVLLANAAVNRYRRPCLEIDAESIRYGSVFQLFRWRVPLADVAEVLPPSAGGERRVVLRMHSGRTRKISLWEVASGQRAAARRAISAALERSG